MKYMALLMLLFSFRATCAGSPDALRGLKEVKVVINTGSITDEVNSQIRNDVEHKLRLAGIKTSEDAADILCINAIADTMTYYDNKVIGYYTDLLISLINRNVMQKRNTYFFVPANIWLSQWKLIHGPRNGFNKRCMNFTKDMVDEFIHNWMTANGN